jgi:sec-independent protein translocase protein TatA
MGSFGTTEIILIVAVLFLLFGATRLPQLAKSLGQSKKAFKEGMREAELEDREPRKTDPTTPPQINQMSDTELADEMRRRSEAKTS